MKWLTFFSLICLICLIATEASSGPHRSFATGSQRINVRVYDGNRSGIIFHKLDNGEPIKENPCFPYSCKGIGPEVTNPNPRKESEKPTCYYGLDDVLFFEKEGSVCPYIRAADPNTARIERRKQEHLAQEKNRTDVPKP